MSETPKNLVEAVQVEGPSDMLLEALLPVPSAHQDGDAKAAEAVLREHPDAATANIWVAAASGELEAVRSLLSASPEIAQQRGGTRHWEPLLYLCFSRWLRTDDERAERMTDIARLLLNNGADPNCSWIDPAGGPGARETALYGATGVASRVELARLLVQAGADPNDGETPYHMVEHPGVPCADFIVPLLEPLSCGAALGHLLDYDDLPGLRKMLELGADPDGPTPFNNLPLHQAVWRGRGRPFFDLLGEHGADVNRPTKDGKTAYALAARAGRREIMSWLVELGATTELAPVDEFLSACALADEDRARGILTGEPDLLERLSDVERASICEAAAAGNTDGVRTMLALGWDVNTRGNVWKETALHRAAMDGHLETVQMLIEQGADLTLRDCSYGAAPLGWAQHGGHAEVVRLLEDAATSPPG